MTGLKKYGELHWFVMEDKQFCNMFSFFCPRKLKMQKHENYSFLLLIVGGIMRVDAQSMYASLEKSGHK